MACERFEEALIEEAIAPGSDARLAAHLAVCADCREELARQGELQARITSGVAAMVADGPSLGLLTRVRHQVEAERAPRAFPWMQWVAAGIAVAACAVTVIWYAERHGDLVGRPPVQTVQAPAVAPVSASPSVRQFAPREPVPQQSVRDATQQFSAAAPVMKAPRSLKQQVPAVRTATTEVAQTVAAEKTPGRGVEIIVPPGQREAMLRLVNALQTGRVDAASLLRAAQTGDYALLKIAPIEVKPLVTEENKEDPGKQENH